jgi:hypothetical protein
VADSAPVVETVDQHQVRLITVAVVLATPDEVLRVGRYHCSAMACCAGRSTGSGTKSGCHEQNWLASDLRMTHEETQSQRKTRPSS